jgi:hypothetical protein
VSEIDWNSELRKIEREFDGLPPEKLAETRKQTPRLKLEPTVTRPPGFGKRTATASVTTMLSSEQASVLAVWARVGLVATLATAISFWPYAHTCGYALFAYLGACAMIVIGGLWASMCTWQSRMAAAHMLALLLVVVGLVAVGAQVAPRVGYTEADATHPAHWWCRGS